MTTAKYRLHALKVDRIAVVDRPCVPDAQIVLFKRKGDDPTTAIIDHTTLVEKQLEKADFGRSLGIMALSGAIEAFERSFFGVLFSDGDKKQKVKDVKLMISVFETASKQLLAISRQVTNKDAHGETTPSDIVESFERMLGLNTMSDAFEVLRNHLSFIASSEMELKIAEESLSKLLKAFSDRVLKTLDDFQEKRLTVEDLGTIEKVGRKISSARMGKLKGALAALNQVIMEVEALKSATALTIEPDQEEGMTEEQKAQLEKALLAIGVLEESVKTLTAEKAELVTKVAGLESVITEVQTGVAGNLQSEQANLDKAINALKAEIKGQIDTIESGTAEKIEKALTDIEEKVKTVDKVYQSIAKRMGLKNSLPVDNAGKLASDISDGDPFGDAVRGGRKNK